MVEDGDDVYEELFVDEATPRETLLSAVKPYLRFTRDGEIILQDAYDDLAGKHQILVVILGTKVLDERGVRDEGGIHINELVEITGMQTSSIEAYVYGDLDKLVRSDEGRIFVPNYKVGSAAEALGDDNE